MNERVRYQRDRLRAPRQITYQASPLPWPRPLHYPAPPIGAPAGAPAGVLATSSTPGHRVVRSHLIAPAGPLDAAHAAEVLTAIHNTRHAVALEVFATANTAGVALVALTPTDAEEIGRVIYGVSPGWELVEETAERSAGTTPDTAQGRLCLAGNLVAGRPGDWAPLRPLQAFTTVDPLASLLEAVQPLKEHERFTLSLLIRPAPEERRNAAFAGLTQPLPPLGLGDLLRDVVAGGAPRVPRFEPRLQRALEDRLGEVAFEAQGTVSLIGTNTHRLEGRSRSIEAVLRRFDAGFGGLSATWAWRASTHPALARPRWREALLPIYLTVTELASLWHVPSQSVVVPGVVHLKRPLGPLPAALRETAGFVLGVHRYRGAELPVRLPRKDLAPGHMIRIGATGQGKTEFGDQLLRQLALEPDRPGIWKFDPHGDSVINLAAMALPASREEDIVLLELGDTAYPPGLPLFSAVPGVPRELAIQAAFSLLRLIFREHWSPTRMEDAIYAATATLFHVPGSTLLDVGRLFGDASFRRRALARLTDPVVREFWAGYEELSDSGRREVVRPILYRLRSFCRSSAVRNIVCRTDGVDFGKLMDQRAIVLISLAGPAIQAEADLLGEAIITRLHLAALARLARPRERRRQVFLDVDESQHYRGPALPALLSEGRKLGVCGLLTTQVLDSWSDSLVQAVLGNVASIVAFRCGPGDAQRLSGILRPFTADDLQSLDRFEAIARLHVNGTSMPAVRFRTLPLEGSPDYQRLARIRARTRERYARPRAEVEAHLRNAAEGSAHGPHWSIVDEE